jgi:AcrR family transcriptional regulator
MVSTVADYGPFDDRRIGLRSASVAPADGDETHPGPRPVRLGRVGGQRSDARRNRELVLAAARDLLDQRGLDVVTMDEVAAAAGVGKGTVFRAVGDKAGLARALLDEAEHELQAALLGRRAPLGSDAPPGDRIRAFVRAYGRLLERHAPLIAVADHSRSGDRFRPGAYDAWRQHLAALFAAAAPGLDADAAAHAVLACLAADLYLHLRRDGHWPARRAVAVALQVSDALVPPSPPGRP